MRYLLDTVTLSELRRDPRKIHPGVDRWQREVGDVWLSVVTLNELRYGVRRVERKDPEFAARLGAWYAGIIAQPTRFRIVNVDRPIAELAADFRADYGTPFEDSLIAATAKVHGLTVATRNTGHFTSCGIEVVNPWEFGT